MTNEKIKEEIKEEVKKANWEELREIIWNAPLTEKKDLREVIEWILKSTLIMRGLTKEKIEALEKQVKKLKDFQEKTTGTLEGDACENDPCWYHRMKYITGWLKGEFPWKYVGDGAFGVEITSDEFDFKCWIEMLIMSLVKYDLLPKNNEIR